MRSVRFPNGCEVPALGQGTWFMGDHTETRKQEIAALRHGVDLGMTVIDTAEMYGDGRAELLVGEAVAGMRDKTFLVSKVLPNHADRAGTVAACEASLKRLGTDYIDLYLLHWRGHYPLAETLAGFSDLMAAGKIRMWGVSNFDPADMAELMTVPGGTAVASNQILYNLTRRGVEWELIPQCLERQIPVMAYSPVEQARLLSHGGLARLAQRCKLSPAQLALSWVLRIPGVLAIPKAATLTHVEENRRAADLRLAPDVLAELDRLFVPPSGPHALEML